MLMYPQIDPVALQVGPLAVHWYGLTYLAAFALFMLLGTLRLRHPPFATARTAQGTPLWTRRDVEDILFLGVLGVVLGGRLGYCLFYKPGYYLSHPLEILAVWQGGMSFHGGMLGVIVLALVWSWADRHYGAGVPSFYSVLQSRGLWFLLLAAVFMAAMSVVGDLVESLIKRSVGVKDSSGLLPGHGGVLDRIDALLPTLPLAMMLSSFVHP